MSSDAPNGPEEEPLADEATAPQAEWEDQQDQHSNTATTNTSTSADPDSNPDPSETSPQDHLVDQDQDPVQVPLDYQCFNGMESPEPQANGAGSDPGSTPTSPLEEGEHRSPHQPGRQRGAGDSHDNLRKDSNSKSPSVSML